MELKKHKYKKEEVIELLKLNSTEFEEKLSEQKSRIVELLQENEKLSLENSTLKGKEELVDITLANVEKNYKEQTEKLHLQYDLTCEKLKKFAEKWKAYFNYLKDKYPYYPAAKEAVEISDILSKTLKSKNIEKSIDFLDKKVPDKVAETQKFNPKEKIQEYVNATSENGFNLDEVLNPGELHLEDLCKELGLIEE